MMKRVALFSLLLLLLLLFGCVSERESAITTHGSRLYEGRLMRDSVFVKDCVFIKETPDTVFCDRIRTLFRDRVRVDTLTLCDTITKEKTVTVEKVVETTSWQCRLLLLLLVTAIAGISLRHFLEAV